MDPQILKQIDELESLAKTRNDAWQIPRVEGEMLHQIALSSGAKLIVEIGTSYGFSSLFWGAAMKRVGGRVHSIDIDPRKFEMSRATFASAGLAGVITNHLGDAAAIVPTIAGAFDLVFIDAWKEQCIAYFDLVWPRIRAGGSVITDNAVTHRKELAGYVAHVRGMAGAVSKEVAVGNGIEWTIKAE